MLPATVIALQQQCQPCLRPTASGLSISSLMTRAMLCGTQGVACGIGQHKAGEDTAALVAYLDSV
ncbi:hypothetical protein ACVIYL_008958 [Bradyrhizobium sp. USDA 3315]